MPLRRTFEGKVARMKEQVKSCTITLLGLHWPEPASIGLSSSFCSPTWAWRRNNGGKRVKHNKGRAVSERVLFMNSTKLPYLNISRTLYRWALRIFNEGGKEGSFSFQINFRIEDIFKTCRLLRLQISLGLVDTVQSAPPLFRVRIISWSSNPEW